MKGPKDHCESLQLEYDIWLMIMEHGFCVNCQDNMICKKKHGTFFIHECYNVFKAILMVEKCACPSLEIHKTIELGLLAKKYCIRNKIDMLGKRRKNFFVWKSHSEMVPWLGLERNKGHLNQESLQECA